MPLTPDDIDVAADITVDPATGLIELNQTDAASPQTKISIACSDLPNQSEAKFRTITVCDNGVQKTFSYLGTEPS